MSMARIGRMAGAIVAQTGGVYYLVGDTKEPCDFTAHGFVAPPAERSPVQQPWVRLQVRGEPRLQAALHMDVEGEALPEMLAHRFLIRRNGSVSERLWNVVTEHHDTAAPVTWLHAMPAPVWDIVRDTVLRCV
jgi:hypothetical protein